MAKRKSNTILNPSKARKESDFTPPNGLPPGWANVVLEEVLLSIENGNRPKGGVRAYTSGVPSIGGEHLNDDGGFKFDNIRYVPEDFYQKLNRGKIKLQDVLIVKDGATTGKASFINSDFPYKSAAVNEHVFIIRGCPQVIDQRYLFRYLFSKAGQEQIDSNFKGSAQGGINSTFILNFFLPLPPLPEQDRIIEKLEKLLERVERAKASIENVPKIIKQFRQAVLAAACSGKLVEQDSSDEPASELLKRIRIERRKKWEEDLHARRSSKSVGEIIKGKDPKKYKYEEPVEPDTSELPELPNGWVWAFLDDVCPSIQDGTHYSPKVQYKEPGKDRYLYITSKNIKDEGIDLTDVTYIDTKIHADIFKRCNPENGDVLLIKDGAITGRATINNLDEEFSLLSSVALLKTNHQILTPKYLRNYLVSPLGFKIITGQVTGSAITRIVLHKIKSSPISIPPLAEQKRIVAKVEELFTLADTIEASVKKAQANAERIKQSLLTKAFRGELVEQDPNDESASVLLERIQEEKKKQQ
ncbi:MAG: restriction endonuclease subunit S [Ignavibacteriales bacterium]|nr:restriction endonuclease subunit S [Ignavibacteriales bacterium]